MLRKYSPSYATSQKECLFENYLFTSSPLPWVTANICCQIKSTYNWLNLLDSKPGERLKFTVSLVSLALVSLELVYLFIFLKPLETISKQILTQPVKSWHTQKLSAKHLLTVHNRLSYPIYRWPRLELKVERKHSPKASQFTEKLASNRRQGTAPTTLQR